jgi:predicted metal-dependent HD superfamily phosphohydrolase
MMGYMLIGPWHFLKAYDAYPRFPYHNFDHAIEVMRDARALAGRAGIFFDIQCSVMDAGALYHDVIYEVGKGDNEARSAEFARGALHDDASQAELIQVEQIIVDTKAHQPDHGFIESCLVSDADMGGFAASPEVFDANNARIDDEFLIHGKVDPGTYAAGRRGFLEGTLTTAREGRLFHVDFDLDGRHERAISNLERALAQM